jgi:hypothetical protein
MFRRESDHRNLVAADDLRYGDDLPSALFLPGDYAPGGILDPRFGGLSGDAAGIYAATCIRLNNLGGLLGATNRLSGPDGDLVRRARTGRVAEKADCAGD